MSRPPRFSVGQHVADREADEETLLIVIDPDRGNAHDIYIENAEATVAELNPTYDPTERVVECIHVEWLEHHVGSVWQQWEQSAFSEQLRKFTSNWRLSSRTYDYPEGRLRAAEDADTNHVTGAPGDSSRTGQTSVEDWLR